MRFGQPPTSLQCLALGDSRLVLCGRGKRPSSSSTLPAAELASLRRSSHKIVPLNTRRPRYPVIKNSLKKTLEAQRAANRERLIRKVYNDPVDLDTPLIGREEQIDDGTGLQNVSDGLAEVELSQPSQPKRSTKETKREQLADRSFRVPWVAKGDGTIKYPWLDLIQAGNEQKDVSSALSSEILALAEFLKPSATEQLVVNGVLDDISKRLQGVVPSLPQLVGSRSTQTASTNSTIDLMIPVTGADDTLRKPHHKPRPMNPRVTKMFTDIIQRVEVEIKSSGTFDECRIIYEKSPALVMSHKTSGLSTRIFCGSYLPKSDEFMRASLVKLPSLQPLYMILRVLLESKDIFGWEAASVDSYGLFLLITAVLKQHESLEGKSVGEQLLAVLHTYGFKIDLSTTGVSVNPASFFNIASIREYDTAHLQPDDNNGSNRSRKIHPAYLVGQRALMRYKINAGIKGNLPTAKHLCIQDPTNYLNDAGQRCLRTAELQETLSRLHHELQSAMQRWDDGDRGSDSILGQALLHTNFGDLLRRREILGG